MMESLVSMGCNWAQVQDLIVRCYAEKFDEAAICYQSKKAMQAVRPPTGGGPVRSIKSDPGMEDFDDPSNTLRKTMHAFLTPASTQFYSDRYLAAMTPFSSLVKASIRSATKEEIRVSLGIDGNYELWKKACPGGDSKLWLVCVDARTKELLASEWVPSEATMYLVQLLQSLPANYKIESVSFDYIGEGDNKKVSEIQQAIKDRQGSNVPIYEDLFHPVRCLLEHVQHDKEWFPRFVEKVGRPFLPFLLVAVRSRLPFPSCQLTCHTQTCTKGQGCGFRFGPRDPQGSGHDID